MEQDTRSKSAFADESNNYNRSSNHDSSIENNYGQDSFKYKNYGDRNKSSNIGRGGDYDAQEYGRNNNPQNYGRRYQQERQNADNKYYGGVGQAENHRGKGPKNYTRSSERIKEDVCERLSDAPYIDASDIEISVNGNEITLNGTVSSRQQKRRAEDIADNVSGVTHVQNNLRIMAQNNTGASLNKAPTGDVSGSRHMNVSGTTNRNNTINTNNASSTGTV